MKLRYLKAKNVLSFGDEGIEFEFCPYNVIVGPNDSGKTNLFRVLNLIEKAFVNREPSIEEILFQGDMDRSLHLEVGVELDDKEIDLLSTLIICSEMMRVHTPEDITSDIKENKNWESILKKYGYEILSQSLRHLSFVLEKDELITSEPKMVLKISNESGSVFMDRRSQLSETPEDIGGYQRESLVRLIINDFNSKYENLDDVEINALLQNEGKLSKECPSIVELLIGKLEGTPIKRIELRGHELYQFNNTLRGEPFVAKLSRLCQQRKIEPQNLQNLHPWNILQQMYKASFVRLQELRISPPSLDLSSTGQGYRESTILGNYLARKLFWLTNSGTPSDRERYNRIRKDFVDLTGSEFDVAIRKREVTGVSGGELGVLVPGDHEMYQSRFASLGIERENETRVMNEAYIQVIKNNYPIAIEQTASGLYEILFLLTTIIGENEKILLLDEPELHLHPNMQKRILDLLSESEARSGNQIVMITHSPYFISIEEINSTWRFSKAENGTKAHNLGRMFSELESQEQQEFTLKLSSPIIRSLLFSRGVIFVEGLSDKIAVEQIDRHLSTKNEGANIDENEWSIIDMGSKSSLSKYIELGRMMGIPNVAIMDSDAREGLGGLYNEKQFFTFSTDLEGALQHEAKTRKPLRTLQRIIELIEQNSIPPEFYEMCKFLARAMEVTKETAHLPGHTLPGHTGRRRPTNNKEDNIMNRCEELI